MRSCPIFCRYPSQYNSQNYPWNPISGNQGSKTSFRHNFFGSLRANDEDDFLANYPQLSIGALLVLSLRLLGYLLVFLDSKWPPIFCPLFSDFALVPLECAGSKNHFHKKDENGPNSTIHLQAWFFPFSQEARSKHRAKQARWRSAKSHTSVCDFFVELAPDRNLSYFKACS